MTADTAHHTPGPWRQEPDTGTNADGGTIYGPQGEMIVVGVWHNDSTAGLEIDNPADAALILAAPDLLAALELVEARGMDTRDPVTFSVQIRNTGAWEIIRAAIAKARGIEGDA